MSEVTVPVVESSDLLQARSKGREMARQAGLGLADQTRLATAISEVTRNVIKYAGSGTCTLRDESNAEYVRVSVVVEDDGPGIPSEMQPRLFQPFQSTKAGGTGLGLALVHRVVEGHGGRISVGERSGGGASFTLVLPAKEVAV